MEHRTNLDLKKVLRERWRYRVSAIHPIMEGCYQAITDRGPLFVKIREDRDGILDDVLQGLQVQAYAGRCGIPTNPPLPAIDGALSVRIGGRGVQVEPWIAHREIEKSPLQWREFGEIVGRLHALDVPEAFETRQARLEPRRALEIVRGQVSQFRNQVPAEYQAGLQAFWSVAERLGDFPAAPRCLIHTDLAWGNLLRTPEDGLLLVDFEGAGVGPAVVDLVEVTTYLCEGPSASGPLRVDAARAFYEGYARHRRLTPDEIPLFPQAHFYHQLYYLADSLCREDYDFTRRMQARLDNWNGGVQDQIIEIAIA